MSKIISFIFFSFLILNTYSQHQKIDTIIIDGAKKTKTHFIQSFLQSKINNPLDSTILKSDIKRLKKLPAISFAQYKVSKSNNSTYQVTIHIDENKTLTPLVNFWTTTNMQFAYKVGLFDYNFLGKNITFGGFYQYNGYNSYGVQFKNPHFFSNKIGLALNYQNWTSEEPLYFNSGVANYSYNNISYEALGLYEFNDKNNIEIGVNFFTEHYKYLTGTVDAGAPLDLKINKKLIKFIYSFNNLDFYFQYIEGFKNKLYIQNVVNSQGSNEKFFIAWNDFFYFHRLGTKGNWANRLRIGLSTNNNSPFAPFTLDNNVNIRGVGNIIDRGTGSIVYNTEYRHTLYEYNWFSLQGNYFIDSGAWRKPGGDLSDFTQTENIKIYSGIGLRLIHKKIFNAVFRIDYGFEVTSGNGKGLVFGIGQYF